MHYRSGFNVLHLLLQLSNFIDLLRTRAAGVKLVAQPLLRQPPRQLQSDNPLTHAQHLRVVAQHTPLHAEAVVCGDGTNALDLVGCDSDAETGAADEKGTIGLALGDEAGGGGGTGRVGSLVRGVVGADIDDLRDAIVSLEILLDGVLVADASVLEQS